MSTQNSGSKYPPRTSSVSKAKESLGQLNSAPPTLIQILPDMNSTPRSFFTKVIGNNSQSPREIDTQSLTIAGAPCNELLSPQFVPPSGILPVSPNYVYNKGKHSMQYNESGMEPLSGRSPLLYRHSSSLQSMQTNCEHAAFPPKLFNDDRFTPARHSQALAPPYTITPSQSNLSKSSALSSQGQTQQAGAIRAIKNHSIIQPPLSETCERLETMEQLPQRPVTSTSIGSESSYSSEVLVTHSGASKLKAWTKGLKKWSFSKGKNKEKQSPRMKGESPVGQRPRWRRSAADLLPSHSGGYREREERDRLSGIRQFYWKTHSSQQSFSTSEISMEGNYRASYDATPLHKRTLAYDNLQPQNTQIHLGNRARGTNDDCIGRLSHLAQPERLSRIHSPHRGETQSDNNEGLRYPITRTPYFAAPHVPQSISIIGSYYPETNTHIGVSSPEELDHVSCSNGLDFASDSEDVESDEDETITLKTNQGLRPPARVIPETKNLAPISEKQTVYNLGKCELNEIFANPISAGYGTFNRLFQTQSPRDWKSVNQIGQHSGRICFSHILSFVSAISNFSQGNYI